MRADLVNNALGMFAWRQGRKLRPVPNEGQQQTFDGAANAALECGGSRHGFPAVVYTGNRQKWKQSTASLFVQAMQMNDCGELIEKRRLPPQSKALRAL